MDDKPKKRPKPADVDRLLSEVEYAEMSGQEWIKERWRETKLNLEPTVNVIL